MPQIGWFEILVVVVLAILIIGPKDFPIVIRRIGNWAGSIKRYFSEIQRDITNLHETIEEEEVSVEKKYSKQFTDKKKDE